jgi:hypothetical protein
MRGKRSLPSSFRLPAGSRSRRTGWLAAALLAATAVSALILARFYHQVAALVAVVGGLPGLYLAWAAYRANRQESASKVALVDLADQLAVATAAQWDIEASVRRLNDPYPLPVSWTAADTALADDWDVLIRLPQTGAGWPSLEPGTTWASGPDELAGVGNDLATILTWVPTGRLVVLGEPGSGKTMLMVRLVLDLLKDRVSGGPVPVLISMASWNPQEQDLNAWLAELLAVEHSALAAPGPGGATRATELLATGLILPILDGLDEIPAKVRGPAISKINDALRPGQRAVVTCRTQEYHQAVRPANGPEVTLRGAAAIQLNPLEAEAVVDYLVADAGGPVARARWEPVVAALGTSAPVGQALATPLMVGLARTIYNPRAGELASTVAEPAELCEPSVADQGAVESLLFDGFIPAAYRSGSRWTLQQTKKWLLFLAQHLEYTIRTPDLEWWRLVQAVPFRFIRSGVAFFFGITVASLIVITNGGSQALALISPFRSTAVNLLIAAVMTGVTLAAFAWFGKTPAPIRSVRIRPGWVVASVGAGVLITVYLGTLLSLVPGIITTKKLNSFEIMFRPSAFAWPLIICGLLLGLVIVPGLGFLAGLRGVPDDLDAAASPESVLRRDLKTGLLIVLLTVIISVPLLTVITKGHTWTIGRGPFTIKFWTRYSYGEALQPALVFGLAAGTVISASRTAWPSYLVCRIWLALRGQLPWRLMRFLSDAHRRGILRQAGAAYQFRHVELQHRLATNANSVVAKGAQGARMEKERSEQAQGDMADAQ